MYPLGRLKVHHFNANFFVPMLISTHFNSKLSDSVTAREDAKLLAAQFPLVYLDSRVYELVCHRTVPWIELVRGYFASFVWLRFPNYKATVIEGKRTQLLSQEAPTVWVGGLMVGQP